MTPNSAENTAPKQRGRPFKPGESGNPSGRPKGARNHATVLAAAMLDGQAEAIIRKLIDTGLSGDVSALRICLERLLPPKRSRPVAFELPAEIKTPADIAEASQLILQACASGDLSVTDANDVLTLISVHTRNVTVSDLDTRVRALEERNKSQENYQASKRSFTEGGGEHPLQKSLDAWRARGAVSK